MPLGGKEKVEEMENNREKIVIIMQHSKKVTVWDLRADCTSGDLLAKLRCFLDKIVGGFLFVFKIYIYLCMCLFI